MRVAIYVLLVVTVVAYAVYRDGRHRVETDANLKERYSKTIDMARIGAYYALRNLSEYVFPGGPIVTESFQ